MRNVVLILLVSALFCGCVSRKDAQGNETWEFAPVEAITRATKKVSEIPDDTKVALLEGLAMLLGATGIGAAGVPACKFAASRFRKRAKENANAKERAKARERIAEIKQTAEDFLPGNDDLGV